MNPSVKQGRKWQLVQFLGILLGGIGLCFALAFVAVNYSEERLAKEKQQLTAKMDEMKTALTTAKVPANSGTASRAQSSPSERGD